MNDKDQCGTVGSVNDKDRYETVGSVNDKKTVGNSRFCERQRTGLCRRSFVGLHIPVH